jgi:Tfp pilus assembly protein PilO
MRLNTEKQTIVVVSIFSGIILLIVLGIIVPTAQYIKHLNDETTTLKNYLEKKYETTANLRSSIKKIEEIKMAVNEYSQYFFKSGDELSLITALENIAAKNKVTQKIENSNLDQKASGLIKVSLSVNGEYEKTLKYLSDLEKLNYFINVERLQLTSAGTKPGESASSTQTNLYLDFSLYVNQ